jgi:hypothetical protein
VLAGLAAAAVLTACGGGGSSSSCDLPAQQAELLSYMNDWYLFYASMPKPSPDPAGFTSFESYFAALLVNNQDHWSNVQSSASFDAFFNAGQSLGYGLFVAGQLDDPLPLRVRYVAPGSPAASAGIVRGMVIDSIDRNDTTTLKQNNDFSLLTPTAAGQVLTLGVRDNLAATPRTVAITSAVHALTPVNAPRTFTSTGGRKVGYLYYMNFINNAAAPLASAIDTLKTAGVQDLVLDLRYNPGGLISMSRDLASAIKAPANPEPNFVNLTYNDRHLSTNGSLPFNGTTLKSLNLSRVYVLSGVRTCSASELVINGLAPHMQVVQIGGTSCGKPYGFNPREVCGRSWSVLNFASTNSRGDGAYVNGLVPTSGCQMADDFDHALGDPAEALTATALRHIDTGSCAAPAGTALAGRAQIQSIGQSSPRRLTPDGDAPWAAQMH